MTPNSSRWRAYEVQYRGFTHFIPMWLLPVWKWLFCKRKWHLFDEVLSSDFHHFLYCDACGEEVRLPYDKDQARRVLEKTVDDLEPASEEACIYWSKGSCSNPNQLSACIWKAHECKYYDSVKTQNKEHDVPVCACRFQYERSPFCTHCLNPKAQGVEDCVDPDNCKYHSAPS